jgi:hypothetical protein
MIVQNKAMLNLTLVAHLALPILTAVEECLIARSHPLGVILKLRPGGGLVL